MVRLKVLHYISSIGEESGGIGAFMQLITRDLGKLCELHVVTHRTPNMRKLENCEIHFIPENNNPFSSIGKKEVFQLLDTIQPSIVHINGCWLPLSARIAMWSKAKGYKVIYTPHGMLEPWIVQRHYWTRKLPAILLYQKKSIAYSDIVHATAESEKNNLLRLGWNNNISVVGNCVHIDKISIKESWSKKKNLLFLSRVHVKKGINFLVEAASELKDELVGYTINIAGPGDDSYVNELKSLAERLGVDDLVKFIGPIFGDNKFKLYRDADLFVLPTHSENFGIVVTEALASGTPVITTKGTPWEELETDHCGWWVEIGTKPLVEALRKFLACSEDELKQMGMNGRKLVEEKYSSDAVAQQFIEMYESLA